MASYDLFIDVGKTKLISVTGYTCRERLTYRNREAKNDKAIRGLSGDISFTLYISHTTEIWTKERIDNFNRMLSFLIGKEEDISVKVSFGEIPGRAVEGIALKSNAFLSDGAVSLLSYLLIDCSSAFSGEDVDMNRLTKNVVKYILNDSTHVLFTVYNATMRVFYAYYFWYLMRVKDLFSDTGLDSSSKISGTYDLIRRFPSYSEYAGKFCRAYKKSLGKYLPFLLQIQGHFRDNLLENGISL